MKLIAGTSPHVWHAMRYGATTVRPLPLELQQRLRRECERIDRLTRLSVIEPDEGD